MDTPIVPIVTTVKPTTNRIDKDLKTWERMEEHFSKRYGANVWKNRESQLVKKDIYAHILREYGNKKLSREEKMEYRMLQGQVRQMNRSLYPNPYVRLARNILSFGINTLKTIADVLLLIPKTVIAALRYDQPVVPLMQTDGREAGLRVAFKNDQPTLSKDKGQRNDQAKQQPTQQKNTADKGQPASKANTNRQQQQQVQQKSKTQSRYFQPITPGKGVRH